MTEGCFEQFKLEVEIHMTKIGRSRPEIRAAKPQPWEVGGCASQLGLVPSVHPCKAIERN